MTDATLIIGYVASSSSMLAFGSQFVHTIQTKATAGISLWRCILDTVSLVLWMAYATRVEDIPLLIATTTELFFSILISGLIIYQRRSLYKIKDLTPPSTPPVRSEDCIAITIRSRANSI